MKLTFTCPECDTLIQESDIAMTEYSGHWSFENILTCRKCPKCAKLRYGPLTEEMVAEALRVAAFGEPTRKWPDFAPEFDRQARFVLRLLHVTDLDPIPAKSRDDILTMARQP